MFKLAQYTLAIGLLVFVLCRAWEPPGESMGLKHLIFDHLAKGQIHVVSLLGSVLLLAVAVSITIIRWHLLLGALGLGIEPVETARLGWIGFYFNTLLPGSIGGDLVKATVLARRFPGRRIQAVATVLLDRGFALWNLFLCVSLACLLLPPADPALARLGFMAQMVCLVSIVLWWILGYLPRWRADRFAGRLRRWLPGAGTTVAELWLALYQYRHSPGIIFLAVCLSGLSQASFILSFVGVGWGLALDDESMPSVASHFLLVPMAMMVNAIPLFPGGLGIGEWGYGTLYRLSGGESGAGIAASLGHRVVNWVLAGLALMILSITGKLTDAGSSENSPT